MLVLYKRWKKYNEFQLTRNKMTLNSRKLKIIHPPPSEESHPLTDPNFYYYYLGKTKYKLGKTVEETGDELITTSCKFNNNKYNIVVFYKKCKR